MGLAVGDYVQSADNLSQEGLAWLYDDSKAYHNAKISDDAEVSGGCMILNNTQISTVNKITGGIRLVGNVWIGYDSKIEGSS